MEEESIQEMANKIIVELNRQGNLGAYIGNVTSADNYVIRFNSPKIPSILVAVSYLNEPYIYRYNICLKQKNLMKEEIENMWVHYYPFSRYKTLINEMMKYKPFAK